MRISTRLMLTLTVRLAEVTPPIWRRITVGESCTLAQLHEVLQITMGWKNYHLYEFQVTDQRFEPADPEARGEDSNRCTLAVLDLEPGAEFTYVYDFGDDWQHELHIDSITDARETECPRCLDGARGCPPEDCGGPLAYADLLRVLQSPEDPDFAELIDWVPDDFAPEAFDVMSVNLRLQRAHRRGVV